MAEFYPPASPGAPHPYGVHVALLAGATYDDQRDATLAAVRAAFVASVHVLSGTTLADRLVQTNHESPETPEAAICSYASAYDISIGSVDVWVLLPTGGERGVDWPSIEDDKSTIDAILAMMAPTPP